MEFGKIDTVENLEKEFSEKINELIDYALNQKNFYLYKKLSHLSFTFIDYGGAIELKNIKNKYK